MGQSSSVPGPLFLRSPSQRLTPTGPSLPLPSPHTLSSLPSDAFGQKFGRTPTQVNGFPNLFCLEIDPTADSDEAPEGLEGSSSAGVLPTGAMMSKFMKEFGNVIPGIDELVSFSELMRHVQRLEYDVTVFDTAPTGHTLRLLSLPGMMDKALTKILSMRSTFGPLLSSAQMMMGGEAASGLPSESSIVQQLESLKGVIDAVQARIHEPAETTFVCVCIPEFLSLYETERLVQELSKFDIDTHNIVVNQVLFEAEQDKGSERSSTASCSRCASRSVMQAKYLEQISDLYAEDFHVVRTPLLNEEVRGGPKLKAFGSFLLKLYNPSEPLPPELEGAKKAC